MAGSRKEASAVNQTVRGRKDQLEEILCYRADAMCIYTNREDHRSDFQWTADEREGKEKERYVKLGEGPGDAG